jgi:DNA-binding NarL/FixJ family response regulator
MSVTRIMLVDDHTLLRETLRERLQREMGFLVVGVAPDAETAVALAQEHQPDVVLMDIDMPGLSSFEAARRIQKLVPQARVVFLSAFIQDQFIEQALACGAYGYLAKHESPERVVAAVRSVAHGIAQFSDEVRARLVVDARGAVVQQPGVTRLATLSTRERETLGYLGRGLASKEIAEVMSISRRTVEKYIEKIMRKVEIHDRVTLACFAIGEGLVRPAGPGVAPALAPPTP